MRIYGKENEVKRRMEVIEEVEMKSVPKRRRNNRTTDDVDDLDLTICLEEEIRLPPQKKIIQLEKEMENTSKEEK